MGWAVCWPRARSSLSEDDRGSIAQGAPPVPVTAIYSRTDGVVAWQCGREEPGPFRENIEVPGSHCGLGHHPAAAYAIADRLAQPEGEWRQFDSSGVKRLFYPDPNRAVSV